VAPGDCRRPGPREPAAARSATGHGRPGQRDRAPGRAGVSRAAGVVCSASPPAGMGDHARQVRPRGVNSSDSIGSIRVWATPEFGRGGQALLCPVCYWAAGSVRRGGCCRPGAPARLEPGGRSSGRSASPSTQLGSEFRLAIAVTERAVKGCPARFRLVRVRLASSSLPGRGDCFAIGSARMPVWRAQARASLPAGRRPPPCSQHLQVRPAGAAPHVRLIENSQTGEE